MKQLIGVSLQIRGMYLKRLLKVNISSYIYEFITSIGLSTLYMRATNTKNLLYTLKSNL